MKRLTLGRLALCVLCGATLFALLPVTLAHGQQKWQRTYGRGYEDKGRSVQQTSDRGYIVTGWTNDSLGMSYVWLIKTDSSGAPLWTRTYSPGGWDFGYYVEQTQDGGYIIAGSTYDGLQYDAVLIKTDASGGAPWSRVYGLVWGDYANCVRQTADGGYIVSGTTYSYGDTLHSGDVWLFKTNSSGDVLWSRYYGGAANDFGYLFEQTLDGGYIIAGSTRSFRDPNWGDVYLVKTDSLGNTLWTKTYGDSGWGEGDWAWEVKQTTDGGYIVSATTRSFSGNYDQVWLLKLNSSGDTLWTKIYGGSQGTIGRSVLQTADGGYIVTGITYCYGDPSHGDVFLMKTNASGVPLWSKAIGGLKEDYGYSARQTSDGGYIVAGHTYSFVDTMSSDVYLIKTDANGNVGVEEGAEVRSQKPLAGITATPNPFISFATLPGHEAERFSLYDISGRKVGTCRGDRVGEGLAPGVYFLRSSDGNAKPLRIIKVR